MIDRLDLPWCTSKPEGRRIARFLANAGGALTLLALAAPPIVRAHDDGEAVDDCSGCHNGGRESAVTIASNSDRVAVGQTVRFTISIASAGVAGFFFRPVPKVGQLSLVAGEPTRLLGSGVTHSAPKASAGQVTTFAVDWKAPAQAGDVAFLVSAVAGNADGRSSGDATGGAYRSMVFGCTGTTYYEDADQDGHGAPDRARMACSQPPLFATVGDDCDDYDAKVHPGGSELCNTRDDDCDMQIDEGLTVQPYCADADGDGHGLRGGTTLMGCGPSKGYGLCDDDCNDRNAAIFPTATEVCNYQDDNCNQRVDEGARAECGVGWCRRYSEGCNASLCVPGKPVQESCNALDDDCDGTVDEGTTLCAAGEVCSNGACLSADRVDAGRASDAGGLTDARDAGQGPLGMDAGDEGDANAESDPQDAGCSVGQRSARPQLASALFVLVLFMQARRRRRMIVRN